MNRARVNLFGKWMRSREIAYTKRDDNRVVRPFAWGLEFISDHVNGADPRAVLREHTKRAMQHSDEFYSIAQIEDWKLTGDRLTWTSTVETPSPINNIVHARLFTPRRERKNKPRAAVVVLPQWNAQPDSHVEACRIFNGLGMTALRLTLPYHEDRRPPEIERAEHLVSSNIGRTIQSMRQAVVDTRSAVRWLKEQGFERIGILGTSIGSCTAFLAFTHDEAIDVGVFNHVSGFFADVVWKGISTDHVKQGIETNVTLEELREFWKPISPVPFVPRLLEMKPRPMRFIAARYDLTFPVDLSKQVIAEVKSRGIDLDVVWLPCGHYTTAEMPWKAMDAWKIATFMRKHL
ncbi:MAG: RcgR family putative quorum lactone hydrolase [Pyrinomonadaceae bacterium]